MFTRLSFVVAMCVAFANFAAAQTDPMFAFRVPAMDKTGAEFAPDMSGLLAAKPAGAQGFIRADADGHFYEGSRRFRVWGTNVAFAGNFPPKEDAPKIARRFAQLGVNVVRLHSMDCTKGTRPSLIDNTVSNTMTMDSDMFDRADFFIASLAKEGVYVNVNLAVNREPKLDDAICTGVPQLNKNVSLFDRRLIDLQKQYAEAVLGHTNPYTGKRWADDPAVAFVEINNENSFFYAFFGEKLNALPECYASELTRLWNAWLVRERAAAPGTQRERPKTGKNLKPTDELTDYAAFLADTEREYYREMRDFIKHDLGAKMPVTGTMAFTYAGAAMQAELFDYVDIHGYWDHPGEMTDAATGKTYTGFDNAPMTHDETWGPLGWMSYLRVQGKPFTVSEYNCTTGHWYEAENLPLGAAFAAAMDWDGVYSFNWNQTGKFDEDKIEGFFDLCANPVRVAQTAVGAALFLRGDYPADALAYWPRVEMNTTDALRLATGYSWADPRGPLAELFGDAVTPYVRGGYFSPTPEKSKFLIHGTDDKSSTISLPRLDAPKGRRLLETARTLGVVGPLNNDKATTVKTPDGTAAMSVKGNTFAAVTLTALNADAPIRTARKMLLVAGGRTMNTKMTWRTDGTGLTAGGVAPTLTEAVAAEIELTGVAPGLVVYALDANGTSLHDAPIRTKWNADHTRMSFSIGKNNTPQTVWYLLQVPVQ